MERSQDQRQIREQATEEARLAGETLRKLLADFSKVKKTTEVDDSGGEVVKRAVVEKGTTLRQERDAAWQKVWDDVNVAGGDGDGKEDAAATGLTNGDLEGRKTEAESKGWLDVVVNFEKDLWRKGTVRRVTRKEMAA